jgi:hypothetical protein
MTTNDHILVTNMHKKPTCHLRGYFCAHTWKNLRPHAGDNFGVLRRGFWRVNRMDRFWGFQKGVFGA